MPLATLTLFPPYSLDTSILVAVLVGVLVLAALTETLGWVFVGLVVPGYLASVFVIHPEAGVTVSLEALLTYGLAVLLARALSKTGAWSEFFGRERFFLVVLASVLVRAVCEAWLLPLAGALLDERLGTTFTLDRTLHSIGLVLVPLTANAFWKLNLRRGVLQVAVPVAITYAVLRWVLLPYTNLSFSSLELTYEDIAQTFLVSPKAYILLLTTAILAARFNLRYGWDFNGILVPALIALTWMTPSKLVATLVEVLLLVLLTRGLLSLPGISTMNLEGARKTVLVFTVGFLLKWCLGWFFGGKVPGLKVTDLFGFGYLVPTLLAVKILQKKVITRTLLATVHTSFAGFALGSVLGFVLSLVEPRTANALPEPGALEQPSIGLARSPLGLMAIAHATARELGTEQRPLPRRRAELRRYAELWQQIDPWLHSATAEDRREVERAAARLGLRLVEMEPRADGTARFALLERDNVTGKQGWDTALLAPGARGPVLEVPRPISEAPTAEAAATLCERVACRAILVSGIDTVPMGLLQGDALLTEGTPLYTAHLALERHPRIQLRADAALSVGRPVLHSPKGMTAPAALWPEAVQQPAAPPEPGLAWEGGDTVVLRAHPDDLAALVIGGRAPAKRLTRAEVPGLLATPVRWTGGSLSEPSPEELAVLEEQVAAPLLELEARRGQPSTPALRLGWVATMAELFGLALHPVADEGAWLLVDRGGDRRVGAGMLVRPDAPLLALEVPVPDREEGTLPIALEVFDAGAARVVVFAGPPLPFETQAPHPAMPGNPITAFQAFHQAAHRTASAQDGAVVELRGFLARPGVDAQGLVDLDGPVLDATQRPAAVERLFAPSGPLAWLSPQVRWFDGAPEQVGFADASPQQGYSRAFGGATHATLWISDQLRGAYVSPRRTFEDLALTGLGPFPLAPARPERVLFDGITVSAQKPPEALRHRFDALMTAASRAVRERDVHALGGLARAAAAKEASVRALWSPEHNLPYLVVEVRQGRRVLRGVQFLQDAQPPRGPAWLAPGDRDALAAAVRIRRPLAFEGELGR